MTTATPLRRGINTFLYTLGASGALVALVNTDLFDQWQTNAAILGLSVLVAAIQGVAAWGLAYSAWWKAKVSTPITKAIAQFFQHVAAGFAGYVLTSVDGTALLALGNFSVNLLGAAVLSAILAYATNRSDGT